MRSVPGRRLRVVLVVLLLVLAGCSSIPGGGGASPTAAGTATPDPGTPGNDRAVSDPASATATASSADGDGHSHSHGETAADVDTTTPRDDATANDDAGATGRMAVVIDGTRLNLAERTGASTPFRVDADAPDTWHAAGSPTLATALSAVGVDATAASLSFDGETYRDGQMGTEVVYRVDGEPVNPPAYRLKDGDEVWVLVVTNGTDAETPGEYIPPERLHVHGSMEFVVDGDSLDFSREKWQAANHNSHFHFEGGHDDPWHAHSWSVTLGYALSTLADIDANGSGVTYNGTTYPYEGGGRTASVTVNGDPVDPTTYYLKDGDSVRIVLEPES